MAMGGPFSITFMDQKVKKPLSFFRFYYGVSVRTICNKSREVSRG